MIIATGANLMVVFRVERDLLNDLLWEVKLAKYSSFMEPIISHSFRINSVCDDESHILGVIRETE